MPHSLRGRRALGALLAFTLSLAVPPRLASAAELVVFAAASLKEALDDAVNAYRGQTGDTAKISYAASSTLAK